MAGRQIEKTMDDAFIIKTIPFDESLLTVQWPEASIATESKLQACFDECKCKDIFKLAIIQQYNEIFLYNYVDSYTQQILAPQCGVIYNDAGHLPKIIYPKFQPLCEEKTIWQYNEQNCLVLLGYLARAYNIARYDLFTFIEQAHQFCIDWDIREDDILLNPSNLGFHPVFGLRILDYGLTNEKTILNT